MLIAAVVSAYLALVFPDVAVGEPSTSWTARVKTSVARLRGNFWLLVRAAILAFLPLIVLHDHHWHLPRTMFRAGARLQGGTCSVPPPWCRTLISGLTVRARHRARRSHGVMAL